MAVAEVRFADVTRAVVAAAAGFAGQVERRVVGDGNVRTARGNAWAAICADRARARDHADMAAMVAALAAARRQEAARQEAARRETARCGGQRAVGSSPRSSASQAALVSTR